MHDGPTKTSIKFQVQGFIWFYVYYTSPPSKPFALESPPFETLNDQHIVFILMLLHQTTM